MQKHGRGQISGHVFLDDQPIADAFWTSLTPRLADWGDIAVAVYAADRLCKRPPFRDSLDWGRRIELSVPVRDAAFWTQSLVKGQLSESLLYLTDDEWTFQFFKRRTPGRNSENPTLFSEPVPSPASAALFSGGLDSLAGLVTFLAERSTTNVALFSAHTAARIQVEQAQLVAALSSAFPGRLHHATAAFGIRNRVGHSFDNEERSQRTRGFAFQVLGIITAHVAGCSQLKVFENGIGAINLPYLESQLGSQCTRATTPLAVKMMSELAGIVLGHAFALEIPYLLRTKSELCAALRAQGLEHLVQQTVSCDHFPQRNKDRDQCGACSSCLLRRQALFSAGLAGWDRDSYVHPIIGLGNGPKAAGWFALHAMDDQVARLSTVLDEADAAARVGQEFPAFHELLVSVPYLGGITAQLLDLFRRYCDEWSAFRSTHRQSSSLVRSA